MLGFETNYTSDKRALFISTEYPPGPGGIGCHAYHISNELNKLGWQVCVVTEQNYCTDKEVNDFNSAVGFEINTLKTGPSKIDWCKRWLLCKRIIHRLKPNIIIATNRQAVYFAYLLAKRFRIKLVAIGHGTEFGLNSKCVQFLNRFTYSRAQLIIAVSEFTKKYIESKRIKNNNIVVMPNGANDSQFKVLPEKDVAQFKNRMGLSGKRIILTVGSVSQRKGQWVVIESLPSILQIISNAMYVVVGRGEDNSSLKKRIVELGVEKNVLFAGVSPTKELNYWYNACDVFAMTSVMTKGGDFEGFGIAVIEAALCSKPAIVSDNSGLVETVENNITGVITQQQNTSLVAQVAIKLLINDHLRESMGMAAKERAKMFFTWNKVAQKYNMYLSRL